MRAVGLWTACSRRECATIARSSITAIEPLAHSGIGIAGDVFDYRIIDRAIAPLLGKGDTYRVMGKPLPVPRPLQFSSTARRPNTNTGMGAGILRRIAPVAACGPTAPGASA